MTRFHALLGTLVIGAATVVLAGPQGSAAASLFQQGLLLERAEGNVAQAIVLYERVIAEYPTDTAVMPQVLQRLAETYDRQSDARAVRMWSRLATDFGGTSYGVAARQRLAASGAQAGPFRARSIDTPDAPLDVLGFAPDGQSVAFRRRTNAGDEIWVRVIDTGRDRQLSREAGRTVELVTWSPDSRRLVAATSPADAPRGWIGWDLRVVASQGGNSQTVATTPTGRIRAFWSPDSRWLITDVGVTLPLGGESRLIDATSGQSRNLVAAPTTGVAWSRDGRQAVFTTGVAGNFSFWLLTAETGDVRPWTVPLSGVVNLAAGVTGLWTTDNRVLVRQQEAPGFSFYLVPAAGGPAEKTCTSTPRVMQCAPAMTPDGRVRVAEDAAASRLLLFDLGKLDTPRRAATGSGRETSPMLSPDGRLLAFASNADGAWALYVVPVDRAPADAVRVAPLGSNRISAAAWTSSGRLVTDVYTSDEDVYRINMDANGRAVVAPARLTQDTRGNDFPVVSPDSTLVAYTHENGLAVMAADGAGERPVLQARTLGKLQWRSADEILFRRMPEGGGAPSISSLNIKTGAVQTVIDLPASGQVVWQYVPSRNEIFYASFAAPNPAGVAPGSRQVLRARSLATAADRAVVEIPDLLTSSPFTFLVSPDATQIAYTRAVGEGAARHNEIHLMSIDGQVTRAIWTQQGGLYDWSPDGRFLLHGGPVVMVTDVRSGESWPIEQARDSDTSEWGEARWSPNGAFIVLYRDGWHDEYRAFDGLTYDAVVKLMDAKR